MTRWRPTIAKQGKGRRVDKWSVLQSKGKPNSSSFWCNYRKYNWQERLKCFSEYIKYIISKLKRQVWLLEHPSFLPSPKPNSLSFTYPEPSQRPFWKSTSLLILLTAWLLSWVSVRSLTPETMHFRSLLLSCLGNGVMQYFITYEESRLQSRRFMLDFHKVLRRRDLVQV